MPFAAPLSVSPVLLIDYESASFPPGGAVANGISQLPVTWDDLVWAAVTVGRPNRQCVFRFGASSVYEAIFRWSLLRLAVEEGGVRTLRLKRTRAAATLDPTEKGAVNYFLGVVVAKLFADKRLQASWMLHLDVFRPLIDADLVGRSRPDLFGDDSQGRWVVLECKGRLTKPSAKAKQAAKYQAQRVTTINGTPPTTRAGCFMYFQKEILRFYWEDPPDREVTNPIPLEVTDAQIGLHYAPTLDLLRAHPDTLVRMLSEETMLRVPEADVSIGVHPEVLKELWESNFAGARKTALALYPPEEKGDENPLEKRGPRLAEKPEQRLVGEREATPYPYRRDGLRVVAGPSWREPLEPEATQRRAT